MDSYADLKQRCFEIEEKLGYVFKNKDTLFLAFIHRSFINENKEIITVHNERLEFLGDSVLGLVIADYLYQRLPSHPEGALSQLRSLLVDQGSCVQYIQKLELGEYILLGKGEQQSDGRGRGTILSDVFEAIVGAIFLDGGLKEAAKFIEKHFEKEIDQMLQSPAPNYKADLQGITQKKFQVHPTYTVIKELGPAHSKIFHVAAYLEERQIGRGSGSSKKEAETEAAKDALAKMDEWDGQ